MIENKYLNFTEHLVDRHKGIFSNLIDSMGTVDLAMMLEEEFNIKIDTRDIIESNFDSLTKLANYIKSRVSE